MEAYTRHPCNNNLTLYYQPQYQVLSVQPEHFPYIAEYLERTRQVIEASLQQYSRVFAFRVDLRFPSEKALIANDSNAVIDRFFASFKAKIKHNREQAKRSNAYAHDCTVRYVWCREIGCNGSPHYHVAILLNNDAFCTLGTFEKNRDNLFNRINEAWASAIGISSNDAYGLVHFPENPFYLLQRGDHRTTDDFFYRVSYLSKAATKQYGNGVHGFGASRV